LDKYEKSARLGCISAMVNRAYLHFKMANLAESEYEQIDHYFDCANWAKLALSKNPEQRDAQYLMGVLYEQGWSVDRNLEAAFRCFLKAADLGCIKSNTKVGHMLYSGIKARKFEDMDDEDVLLFMQTEASQAEIEDAKFALRPDRLQALKRYLKSAKNGDSEAANCAGLLLEKINPIDAVDCYRRALEIDEKNSDALLNLALLYYTTKEEKEWHEEAVRLIQRASDLGNEKAHQYLEQRGLLGLYSYDRLPTPIM
jgi:TPR repeat protein